MFSHNFLNWLFCYFLIIWQLLWWRCCFWQWTKQQCSEVIRTTSLIIFGSWSYGLLKYRPTHCDKKDKSYQENSNFNLVKTKNSRNQITKLSLCQLAECFRQQVVRFLKPKHNCLDFIANKIQMSIISCTALHNSAKCKFKNRFNCKECKQIFGQRRTLILSGR